MIAALWELFGLLRQALAEGVPREVLREAIKREMTWAAEERMRQAFRQ